MFIIISIVVVTMVRRAQERAKLENIAAVKAEIESQRRRDREEQAKLQKALSDRIAEMTKLDEAVKNANTEAERMALAQRARTAAAAAARAAADAAAQRKAANEAEKKRKLDRCKNADDPLCGL